MGREGETIRDLGIGGPVSSRKYDHSSSFSVPFRGREKKKKWRKERGGEGKLARIVIELQASAR